MVGAGMPEAPARNVVGNPTGTERPTGWVKIAGGTSTVSTAATLLVTPAGFETCTV